jgi:hypothetical protein
MFFLLCALCVRRLPRPCRGDLYVKSSRSVCLPPAVLSYSYTRRTDSILP